jgi:nicotinate dehydrogenase subunit A
MAENPAHAAARNPVHHYTLTIDGKAHSIAVDDPDMPLLYALRDTVGLDNPRFGCGLGQCGACTVHIDGRLARSCITPLSAVGDGRIGTLAGLGTPERPHKVQRAWLDEQVSQCAYCINGWIMTAAALLEEKPHPTDQEIKNAFATLICRCGTHAAAIRAVKRAAQTI